MAGYSTGDALKYSQTRQEITVTEHKTFQLLAENVDVRGKSVLDFGCGDGYYSIRFADMGACEVIGIDASTSFVDIAKEKHAHDNIHYIVANGNALPFSDGTFDVVFSNFVIQHFQDSSQPLKEIYRVLKPDGWLLMVIPTAELENPGLANTLVTINLREVLTVRNYLKTKVQIDAELAAAGFKLTHYTSTPEPDAVVDPSYEYRDKIRAIPASIYLLQKP